MTGSTQSLRVLSVTNMFPTPERPSFGIFVRSQIESLRREGISTNVLFLDGRTSRLAYATAVPAIRHALRKEAYDLVHAHYGLTGFLASLATGAPVVVSFCGSDLLGTPDPSGRMTLGSRLLVRLSCAAARRAAGVIVKSREMLERLPQAVRSGGAAVIPNGVDLDLFSPRERAAARAHLGIGRSDLVALFPHTAGVPRKRLDLARAAVAHVAASGRNLSLRIVEGVPQERLADEYAAADCMLLTSYWEGSPNVVKEALAMNLPVVSVECGDVREWIEGLAGCALVGRDPAAIAGGLGVALDHGPLTAGRERIAAIEIGCVARRVIAVYRAALEP